MEGLFAFFHNHAAGELLSGGVILIPESGGKSGQPAPKAAPDTGARSAPGRPCSRPQGSAPGQSRAVPDSIQRRWSPGRSTSGR